MREEVDITAVGDTIRKKVLFHEGNIPIAVGDYHKDGFPVNDQLWLAPSESCAKELGQLYGGFYGKKPEPEFLTQEDMEI